MRKYFIICPICKEAREYRCISYFKELSTPICKKCQCGKLNSSWKGDKVSYNALHTYIKTHKPKSNICEICKRNKSTELSCVNHNYTRNINKYRWLCKDCHLTYDLKLKILSKRQNYKKEL